MKRGRRLPWLETGVYGGGEEGMRQRAKGKYVEVRIGGNECRWREGEVRRERETGD